MSFKAIAIDVITAPNFFFPIEDDRWEITDPNTTDLWFQLNIIDSLGQRRYIAAAGSTIQVIFQRADLIQSTGTNFIPASLAHPSQTITKTAVVNVDDKSLYKVTLTTTDVKGILSGTVKFKLTENSKDTTFVQNWFLRKNLTEGGF